MPREYAPRQYDDDKYILCPSSGQRIKGHERCSKCGILIGPNHHERQPIVFEYTTICSDCARRIVREHA